MARAVLGNDSDTSEYTLTQAVCQQDVNWTNMIEASGRTNERIGAEIENLIYEAHGKSFGKAAAHLEFLIDARGKGAIDICYDSDDDTYDLRRDVNSTDSGYKAIKNYIGVNIKKHFNEKTGYCYISQDPTTCYPSSSKKKKNENNNENNNNNQPIKMKNQEKTKEEERNARIMKNGWGTPEEARNKMDDIVKRIQYYGSNNGYYYNNNHVPIKKRKETKEEDEEEKEKKKKSKTETKFPSEEFVTSLNRHILDEEQKRIIARDINNNNNSLSAKSFADMVEASHGMKREHHQKVIRTLFPDLPTTQPTTTSEPLTTDFSSMYPSIMDPSSVWNGLNFGKLLFGQGLKSNKKPKIIVPPIPKTSEETCDMDDDPFACIMCCDRRIKTCLAPCGHVILCISCANKKVDSEYAEGKISMCPNCNTEITQILPLFMPN